MSRPPCQGDVTLRHGALPPSSPAPLPPPSPDADVDVLRDSDVVHFLLFFLSLLFYFFFLRRALFGRVRSSLPEPASRRPRKYSSSEGGKRKSFREEECRSFSKRGGGVLGVDVDYVREIMSLRSLIGEWNECGTRNSLHNSG